MSINEIREEIISRKIIFFIEANRHISMPIQNFMLMLARNNLFMEATAQCSRTFDPEKLYNFLKNIVFSEISGTESQIMEQSENRFEEIRVKAIEWIIATFTR